MKQFLFAGAALLATTSLSTAADMPAPEPMPAVVEAYNWSGVYVGVHGGWAWAESDVTVPALPDDLEFEADDFVIGGHIGYNWQWDSIVFGVEGDGSFTGFGDDDDVAGVSTDGEFLASLRGRIGYAADRFLIYGTGGAAWSGLTVNDDINDEEDDVTFFGWAAGGGIEYAFTDNVSFGVEYLHYQFDDEDFDDLTVLADVEADLSVDVVRGRLTVKFGDIFN